MQEPIVWLSEHTVNTFTSGGQTNPQVAALEGGGFVVVWESNPLDLEVRAQIYDAAGYAVGTEFTVCETGGYPGAPDVAALDGGGFVVVWTGGGALLGTTDVKAAIFDGVGVKVVDDFVVGTEQDPDLARDQHDAVVTQLASGGFVVAWMSDDLNGGGADPMWTIKAQRFDGNGNARSEQVTVAQDIENEMDSLAISAIGDSQFVVTWTGGEDGDENFAQQRFTQDCIPVGGILPIFLPGEQQSVAVASDGNGNFLTIGRDIGIVTGQSAYATIGTLQSSDGSFIKVDPNMDPAMPAFAISDDLEHGGITYSAAVVGLHTGGFFAAWMEYQAGSFMFVGQLLDETGNKVGAEFVIKPPVGYDGGRPTVAELSDGRIVVVWPDNAQSGTDSSGFGIQSQILDPRANLIYGTEDSETIYGTVAGTGLGNDTIYGLGGHDSIHAGDGDDSIVGGAGNDTINGNDGDDTMDGGLGDDEFHVTETGDVVKEAVGEGTQDKVISWVAYFELTAGVEVEIIETSVVDANLKGNEFDQLLKSGAGNNELLGGGGNDTLDGSSGVDTMLGGAGDDVYFLDESNDQVYEFAGEGNDTISVAMSYSLSSTEEVENLFLTGSDGIDGTGNALHNKLTGNTNDNHLCGLAGNDTIDGGGGADTMEGGLGNDIYVVDHVNDVVTELVNQGTDTVTSAINYTLGATLENLTLLAGATKGTGNGLANVLIGNDAANTLSGGNGNDTLNGGAGTDSLVGGAGNDTYVLGSSSDKVNDSSGADDQIISTSSRSLGSYTGIENLTLAGTANVNATGNAVANDLIGNAGNNQLKGLNGNDLLRGLGGADQMWGGNGKDIFDFNAIAEIGKTAGKRDIIRDFQHLIDKIDLSSIDASTKAGGNQAFKFVAAEGAKFTGIAGQLIWDKQNFAGTAKDVTLILGDINGDKVADFILELTGLVTLTSADFIL